MPGQTQVPAPHRTVVAARYEYSSSNPETALLPAQAEMTLARSKEGTVDISCMLEPRFRNGVSAEVAQLMKQLEETDPGQTAFLKAQMTAMHTVKGRGLVPDQNNRGTHASVAVDKGRIMGTGLNLSIREQL